MDTHGPVLPVAFSYAWWLTGDDAAAGRAVRAAAARAGWRPGHARVLSAVRAGAVSERTMCPGSEVALLHDGFELPLPDAAGLAAVDPADARGALAHGRLEALSEDPGAPVHPERLGGLAVGNPADVAHARTCPDCARLRSLLDRGRDDLRALAPRPVPGGLAGSLPQRGSWHRRAAYAAAAALTCTLLLIGALALTGV